MPEPLLIPTNWQAVPLLIVTTLLRSLGTVSVVIIACAARSQLFEPKSLIAAGKAALSASTGRTSPITPVEKGKTSVGDICVSSDSAEQLCSQATIPGSPVPAFALPELMRMYRALIASLLRSATSTGAALNAFWVKTAAVALPSLISISVRSSRLGYLIPACATPSRTPGTDSSLILS